MHQVGIGRSATIAFLKELKLKLEIIGLLASKQGVGCLATRASRSVAVRAGGYSLAWNAVFYDERAARYSRLVLNVGA